MDPRNGHKMSGGRGYNMSNPNAEDYVMRTERKIINRYNRVMFLFGVVVAVVIPPMIYKWKRDSMKKLEDGATQDIERLYKQGRQISDIPRKED